MCVYIYIYIYIYSEREINKNDIFLRFDILSFTKTLYIYIFSGVLRLLCVRVLNTIAEELSKYIWTLKANGTDYHLK